MESVLSFSFFSLLKAGLFCVSLFPLALAPPALENSPSLLSGIAFSTYSPNAPLTMTATVYLNRPAPVPGVDVSLKSSHPALAKVPASLHFNAGNSEAKVSFRLEGSRRIPAVTLTAKYGQAVRKGRIVLFEPPNLTTAACGSGKIVLYWDRVPGAVGYHLYRRRGKKPFVRINRTPVTSLDPGIPTHNLYRFVDRGLRNGREYGYRVVAVMPGNQRGVESEESTDTPTANAEPWDTEDAAKILNFVLQQKRDPRDLGNVAHSWLEIYAPNGMVYLKRGDGYERFAPQAEPNNDREGATPEIVTLLPNRPPNDLPALCKILYRLRRAEHRDEKGKYEPESLNLMQIEFRKNREGKPVRVDRQLLRLKEEEGIYGFAPSFDFRQRRGMLQQCQLTQKTEGQANSIRSSGKEKRRSRLLEKFLGYRQVQWSPDASRSVELSEQGAFHSFGSFTRVRWGVFVHNPKTKAQIKIFEEGETDPETDNPSSSQMLTWLTPTRLLYASDEPYGLFLLSTDGVPPVRLTLDPPERISMAEHRAYWSAENPLRTVKFADLPSDPETLCRPDFWKTAGPTTSFAFPLSIREWVVSPDHKTAAVFLNVTDDNESPRRLLLLDLKARTVLPLGVTNGEIGGVRWSKNGKFLLMTQFLRPLTLPNASPLNLITVRIPPRPPQSFDEFDWKREFPPLEWTELLALPPGSDGAIWEEAEESSSSDKK